MQRSISAEKYVKPFSIKYRLLAFSYVFLMTLNFLGELRGFPRFLKGTGIIIVAFAFFRWLVVVDNENIKVLGDFLLMLFLPIIVILTFSLSIWIFKMATADYIIRGSMKVLIQSINIFVAIATAYLLGRDAIRYTLYAMSMAYFIIFIKMILEYGIADFVSSFVYFVTSFGDASGAMRYMEVHDLTFAFGFMLVYYIVAPKGEPRRFLCLILAFVGFFMGYKRIATAGVILAIIYNIYITFIKKKNKEKSLIRFGWLLFVLGFAYIFAIKYGIFDWFAETFNINTMGRTNLYHFINNYYEISPSFMGYGIDYIYELLTSLKGAGIEGISGITAIHNDFLRQYIEIGFWGYIAWSVYETVIHPAWLNRKYGFEPAKLYIVLTVYFFFTYLTDNTMFYYHSAYVYRLLPLVCAIYFRKETKNVRKNQIQTTE